MMTHGENTQFMKNLHDGINYESRHNYEFAIDRYTTAFNIARAADDAASKTPFTKIRVCEAIMKGVEPDYNAIEDEYEYLEERNFKGFSFDSDNIM